MVITINFSQQFMDASTPSDADIEAHKDFITQIDRHCAQFAQTLPNFLRNSGITDHAVSRIPLDTKVTESNFWVHVLHEDVTNRLRHGFQSLQNEKLAAEIHVLNCKRLNGHTEITAKLNDTRCDILLDNTQPYELTTQPELIETKGFQALYDRCSDIGNITTDVFIHPNKTIRPTQEDQRVWVQFSTRDKSPLISSLPPPTVLYN